MSKTTLYSAQLRPVVRKVDCSIHRIVTFQLLLKSIKRSDTEDIDLARHSDYNSKMLDFNMGCTSYWKFSESLKKITI